MQRIEPFFRPMGSPHSSDWLSTYQESGQTFDEYIDGNPTRPTPDRQKIYVLPLGSFSAAQLRVIDITADYLGVFYGLFVERLEARPLRLPREGPDRRNNPFTRSTQVRTGYIMESLLKPTLPSDAAALIAFTNEDLFPDKSMNFVFGQASMKDRVGIWSLSRLDDNTGFATFLRRTLKVATHETGHMFSFAHCTKYECVMSGTNHLGETDRRPIDACPECMAKVCWLTDTSPAERYENLARFCRDHTLKDEAEDFQQKALAVR
jgi:archaemetzincin